MWNYKSADDKNFIYIVRSFIHCFHCCCLRLLHAPLATMCALCNSRFMWSRVGGATLMYPIVVRRFVWLCAAVKDLSASGWCLRPGEEEQQEDKDEDADADDEIEEVSDLVLLQFRTLNVSGISICLRICICIRICISGRSCSCICEVNKPIRLT